MTPVQLPPDPGAGERVLRLSLSEKMVDKLAAGLNDPPAVALRRLMAAEMRPLQAAPRQTELPAPAPAAPEPSREPEDTWYGSLAWAKEVLDYDARGFIVPPETVADARRILSSATHAERKAMGKNPPLSLSDILVGVAFSLGAVLFYLLLFWLFRQLTPQALAKSPPAPTFNEWTPLP